VAPVADPGGAETTLLRLLRELAARGWSITLTAPGPGRLLDAATAAGHTTAALGLGGLRARSGAPAVRAWPRARGLARDADVVLLNGTVCGRLLPALRGLPARTVLSIHDVVERVPRMWSSADVVLAASRAVADSLAPLPAHVVYAPVDLDPPPADPPWEPADGPVVGFVGRIEPRKAPLDFVHAAPAIDAGAPGARVVLVGEDPYGLDPSYTEEVERSAREAGVERYGWVDNAPGVMRHLDVLVLPSRQEPFGTVLSEAMAVGTPVVATRVGGLPEVVEDGVTGRLVAPGDPAALAQATLDVIARGRAMGEAARTAAARFSTERHADAVERLIREELARSASGYGRPEAVRPNQDAGPDAPRR
jgi:glycosyltransferase involved in cell wall biosynthesis